MQAEPDYDLFVSHTSEDSDFTDRLARRLAKTGLRVWYDGMVLKLGDSLRESIDHGIAHCRFGVVVISPSFFSRNWPQRELNALFAREGGTQKIILPVWHNIAAVQVAEHSPILADRLAVNSRSGVEAVALAIIAVASNPADELRSWIPHEILWPDGTMMVVLPLRPIDAPPVDEGGALLIGKHPVTNAQFSRFLQECPEPNLQAIKLQRDGAPTGERYEPEAREWRGPFEPWKDSDFNDPCQPVVCVSFRHAVEYCRWVSGQQTPVSPYSSYPYPFRMPLTFLPSSRLWDFAAFGTEPLSRHPDAWMNSHPVHHRAPKPAKIDLSGERTNMLGVSDMFGNMWEWCSGLSRGSFEPTIMADPRRVFPRDEELRGGSYLDDLTVVEPFLSVSRLDSGIETKHVDVGFRVAGVMPASHLPPPIQARMASCPDSAYPFYPQMDRYPWW